MPDNSTRAAAIPLHEWREALRRARATAGLTQSALGALCRIDSGVVSDYETGRRRPTPPNVDRLRSVFAGLPEPDYPPRLRNRHESVPSGPYVRRFEAIEQRPPLARDLYLRRVEAGLTLAEVARRTGIHISTLSTFETGARRPSHESQRRIREALS